MKFEWEDVKSIGLAQNGDKLCTFMNSVMNISFPITGGGEILVLYEKISFLSTLLYITQSINTYNVVQI